MADQGPATTNVPPPQQSGGSNLTLYVLFGAVIALIAAYVYLFIQVDQQKIETAKLRDTLVTEISNLREASSVTTAANRHYVESLKDQVEASRRAASMAVGQAKVDATKHADDLAKKLADEQTRQQRQTAAQISEVHQEASEANTKIAEVNTDVSSVKTEVSSTKSELDKTIADLKRVTGDLGVTSGLVATNGKELSALKALGDRNYFEFKMGKTKEPQKVGDISIQLKKADTKHNRYTIDVYADDKKVEKKDKNINEPLQFYTSKAPRQPYEVVVNQVSKDQISGYLSTPKVQESR